MKDKVAAALLAFFLGGLGVHRFYLGQIGLGFVYFLFCWTLIPFFVSFVDAIVFFVMDQQAFDAKYNRVYAAPYVLNNGVPKPSTDVAAEIEKLYNLKEKGIISGQEFEQSKRKLLS